MTPLSAHLRSFWLMKPSLSFSTALASMELASLAKSRSRISDTGTDTMAKASLSSLVGQVPSCRDRGQQGPRGQAKAPAPAPWPQAASHHEPNGPLLLNVDGHVGALDPRVGTEVPQPDIGVPRGGAEGRARDGASGCILAICSPIDASTSPPQGTGKLLPSRQGAHAREE